jgi:ankyrin repeat protein
MLDKARSVTRPRSVAKQGLAPLHLAAMAGDVSVMDALLAGGKTKLQAASLHLRTADRRNVAHISVQMKHPAFLARVCAYDAESRKLLSQRDSRRLRPLDLTTDPRLKEATRTPWEAAWQLSVGDLQTCLYGDMEAWDGLGLGLEAKTPQTGLTAMHVAVLAVARRLGDARSSRRDRVAAEASGVQFLQALLRHEAFVDPLDKQCCTPLMLAAEAGLAWMAALLLAKGADPAATDLQGYNALHYAHAGAHADLVAMLEEAGATDQESVAGLRPHEMSGKNIRIRAT